MKAWVNILSLSRDAKPELLEHFVKSDTVDVFSSLDKKVIGKTIRYEVRDEVDLWAEIEVDDTAEPFQRAAGLIIKNPEGYRLAGVLVTNMSREKIVELSGSLDNLTSGQ